MHLTRRCRQLSLWPECPGSFLAWHRGAGSLDRGGGQRRDDRRGVRPQMPAKSRTKTRARPSRALLVCILLFAFCLREPVADGTTARVQTVLGRRAPHGQPLPVGDQLVGRDENANRGSSLCRVACCSHVVVGQMRSIFFFVCWADGLPIAAPWNTRTTTQALLVYIDFYVCSVSPLSTV